MTVSPPLSSRISSRFSTMTSINGVTGGHAAQHSVVIRGAAAFTGNNPPLSFRYCARTLKGNRRWTNAANLSLHCTINSGCHLTT